MLSMDDHIPVWIAPTDLLDLQAKGVFSGLPPNIPNVGGTDDHVKVCLKQSHLITLWGQDGVDAHCHTPSNAGAGVSRFYLGYDGALFCDFALVPETFAPFPPQPPSPPPCHIQDNPCL